MRRVLQFCSVIAGLAVCGEAFAWGAEGHQSVGALADRLIVGTHAQQQVKNILGSDLKTSSVWADCAKGVSLSGGSFRYAAAGKYLVCAQFETPAREAAMVAFVKRNWSNCHPAPGDEPCHKQYHYTDVAIERDAYNKNLVGTSDHDVVGAISAAIAVLQGKPSPAPFKITSRREALRLLSHYVGDIHQPLHVAAIYLDAGGKIVDPDAGAFDPDSRTRGGNDLVDGWRVLHSEWDTIPVALSAAGLGVSGVAEARQVPKTPGPLSGWSTEWATDSLQAGKHAFDGLTFAPEDTQHHWQMSVPADYAKTREALQRTQLIKAGARLAQILEAIWP